MAEAPQRILRREALLLGDSITQYGFDTGEGTGPGWVSILADKFIRKVDIINRGFSGYNTRKVRAILPIVLGEVRREKLLFATLFLGANDSAPIDESPLCSGVPLIEYEENLVEIGQQLLAVSEVLIVIAPPTVDSTGGGAFGRTMDNTRKYAEAAERAANTLGARFVSTFKDMDSCGEEKWKEMLIDGVHLASKGNAFLAERVLKSLDASPPVITPDSVAWDLPGWRDLDRDDPASSLTRTRIDGVGARNAIDVVEPLR